MAIQIARAAGARVLALTSGPERVERARALGAHRVYDRLDPTWSRALWLDTDKRGVDLIVDSVGRALWPILLRSLAVRGRLVSYGATTGNVPELTVRRVFWKQLSVLGSTMGSPDDFRAMLALFEEGGLRPVVDRGFPLADAGKALLRMERAEQFGKIVLRIA